MVVIIVKDEYLNFDSTEDGDLFEILSGGDYSLDKVTWETEKVSRIHLPTLLNGKTKLDWTPWDSDLRKLIAVWGKNSEDYKGKKCRITHDKKKMLISPIVEEKVDGN